MFEVAECTPLGLGAVERDHELIDSQCRGQRPGRLVRGRIVLEPAEGVQGSAQLPVNPRSDSFTVTLSLKTMSMAVMSVKGKSRCRFMIDIVCLPH